MFSWAPYSIFYGGENMSSYHVLILGGGVIGLAAAYYLTGEGLKVLLLDPGGFGGGASGACDGMILLQSKKPGILLEMAFKSLEIYEGLSEELDRDLEFTTRGGMVLLENEEELAVMEKLIQEHRAGGLKVKILTRQELKGRQPHLSSEVLAATYCPHDSQVNPLLLLRAYLEKSLNQGLVFRRERAIAISDRGNRWQVRTSGGNLYEACQVLNAGGAWAGEICSFLNIDLPVKPRRGQLAVTQRIPQIAGTSICNAQYLKTRWHKNFREQLSEEKGGFSFSQNQQGNCFLGSTRGWKSFDNSCTLEGIKKILRGAFRYYPVLENARLIRFFAGLRPATPHGLPILGELRDCPGFFIAAGHEGDGIALGPVTGKIISQLMCGKKPVLAVNKLAPENLKKQGF